MGTTQGRILFSSLNLSFRATSTVSIVIWIMFPDDWPTPPRKGSTCVVVFGGEPLEFEPTLPHQGHALDDEKVLVHGLFQPSAAVPPMIPGSTASRTPGVSSLLPTLRRGGRGSPLPPRRLHCFVATLKALTP